jgi:hypothetical protein
MKARQKKADADTKARHEEAAARQEKTNAELKAAMHSSGRIQVLWNKDYNLQSTASGLSRGNRDNVMSRRNWRHKAG